MQQQIKSRQRVTEHGEVFTAEREVKAMCDLVKQETERIDSRFLEPACGTGNFLTEILARKLSVVKSEYGRSPLEYEKYSLLAVSSLYGVDIMADNVETCRERLYKQWDKQYKSVCKKECNDDTRKSVRFILSRNIVCGNALTLKCVDENCNDTEQDIVFSEWAFVFGSNIQRSDYSFDELVDDFRNNMLNSSKISTIVDFANSADCFPGVTIAGGICYFLWGLEYNGECKIINMNAGEEISSSIRKLNEYPVFVRNNIAIQIIRKVNKVTKNYLDMIVHSRNCFNLFSKEIGHNEYKKEDCVLYSLNGKSYITKNEISDRDNLLNKYKVIMTKAMSGGNKPSNDGSYLVISSTMRVLKPNEVCTETYLCIGSFENETEANNLCDYMKTKFFRFLLLQALTSINISKDKFLFVPLQDFSKPWTDSELYEKYNLTDEEINFIESMIRPMDLGGDNNG